MDPVIVDVAEQKRLHDAREAGISPLGASDGSQASHSPTV